MATGATLLPAAANATVALVRCRFTDNVVAWPVKSSAAGGACSLLNASSYGGVLYAFNWAALALTECTFQGNAVSDGCPAVMIDELQVQREPALSASVMPVAYAAPAMDAVVVRQGSGPEVTAAAWPPTRELRGDFLPADDAELAAIVRVRAAAAAATQLRCLRVCQACASDCQSRCSWCVNGT
jgi:hypothetical protein